MDGTVQYGIPVLSERDQLSILETISVASAQLSFFSGFFITENAVIDVTVRKMVTNIAPLYTFQIKKNSSKCMQPILKYSKNNMWFF